MARPLIYLWSMWGPASHTRALPTGLVNLDTGARYRDRDLNLGADVLTAIERHGLVAYQRYSDSAEVWVLHVPLLQPRLFALTLLSASLTVLLIVFALVRLLGDLGKVVAASLT